METLGPADVDAALSHVMLPFRCSEGLELSRPVLSRPVSHIVKQAGTAACAVPCGARTAASPRASAPTDCPAPLSDASRTLGPMQTSSDRHEYPAHWEADVVLRDGGTARVRPITVDDAERLVSFYEQVSDESKYYRFFAPYPRLSAKDVHRFTHHDFVDRVGLAATIGGEFIATVRYDRIGAGGTPASSPADEAEVAFLVQDAHQGRGVASALLEHIAAVARERGIRRFAAEVLPAPTTR
ncbi:GNAT superfamily N-acetyltransferase [Streptomyces ambofaciens]